MKMEVGMKSGQNMLDMEQMLRISFYLVKKNPEFEKHPNGSLHKSENTSRPCATRLGKLLFSNKTVIFSKYIVNISRKNYNVEEKK